MVHNLQVEVFNLFPGPWGFTQEFETGGNTGVIVKAIDPDIITQLLPASIESEQVPEYLFQGLAM